ncbi:hypothetical protein EAH72_31145 [Pseudomonas caspiana]|nr:hypothetical protein [Pseudomonas caspiana]TPG89836.1 hypothetical protein EAH72_31145 [Pseudomonas caspiana]
MAVQSMQTLKAYQVGDLDIVAAYTPEGAAEVLKKRHDVGYTIAEVQHIRNEFLDLTEMFDKSNGRVETLQTTLREDLSALDGPSYLFGTEPYQWK